MPPLCTRSPPPLTLSPPACSYAMGGLPEGSGNRRDGSRRTALTAGQSSLSLCVQEDDPTVVDEYQPDGISYEPFDLGVPIMIPNQADNTYNILELKFDFGPVLEPMTVSSKTVVIL